MYGNQPKAVAQKETDKQLVEGIRKSGISFEQASEAAVNQGWKAFSAGDMGLAMRRFNQGWLLNPDNGRIYWGYALVLHVRDKDIDGAVEMFERTRKYLGDNATLLTDYGRVLDESGRRDDAIALCEKALAMNSEYREAHVCLIRASVGKGDAKSALRYAKQAVDTGVNLPEGFISVLEVEARKTP